MGYKLGGILKPVVAEPVTLHPGESEVVLSLVNKRIDTLFSIVAMGVSQHDNTSYVYSNDGIATTVPVPLGTFTHPIYTCRDLGAHLDVYDTFKIIVVNNDDRAHHYAALAWYQENKT